MTGFTLLSQMILNGLMAASIYILVALGLTLVLSMTGILQMAHGEIYMLGAYGTYYFCTVLGLHYLLALVISMLIIGLFGIPLEKIFFRPFRGENFMQSAIVAIGLDDHIPDRSHRLFRWFYQGCDNPLPGRHDHCRRHRVVGAGLGHRHQCDRCGGMFYLAPPNEDRSRDARRVSGPPRRRPPGNQR